jgi:hypothetical protein
MKTYTTTDVQGSNGRYRLVTENADFSIMNLAAGQWRVYVRYTTKHIPGLSFHANTLKSAKQAAANYANKIPTSHLFQTAVAR